MAISRKRAVKNMRSANRYLAQRGSTFQVARVVYQDGSEAYALAPKYSQELVLSPAQPTLTDALRLLTR